MTEQQAAKRPGRPRKESGDGQTGVRAITRALTVLGAFTPAAPEMTLAEIAKATAIPKATVFRILGTLQASSFLIYDQEAGRYRLGMKLLELGSLVLANLGLRKAAKPVLTELSRETGATVLMGVLMDDQLLYLDKRDGGGNIRVVSDIGWRRAPHFGMLGMVLMSGLPVSEVERLINKFPLVAHTRFTVTDINAFFTRLEGIRRNGYVFERDEAMEGVSGAAAPVRDYTGKVIAAVGVSLPAPQISEQVKNLMISAVTRGAGEISAAMGFRAA